MANTIESAAATQAGSGSRTSNIVASLQGRNTTTPATESLRDAHCSSALATDGEPKYRTTMRYLFPLLIVISLTAFGLGCGSEDGGGGSGGTQQQAAQNPSR